MSKKYKVIFFTPWETPQHFLKRFEYLTPGGDSKWGNIIATANLKEADYYVVVDEGKPSCKNLDPNKIIWFRREPDCIKQVMKMMPFNVNKVLFKGTFDKIHLYAIAWTLKPYRVLKSLKYTPRKKKLIVVCSGKKYTKAHSQRLQFVKKLAQSDVQFDLFGRGIKGSEFNGKYKGEIPGRCKYNHLKEYTYSIALENVQYKNHISEKIYDCYVSLTMPFYWGCPNIDQYFSPNSYISIDIYNIPQSINKIREIMNKPLTTDQISALEEARDLTLDKYSIWPTVDNIIKNLNEN